MTKLPLSIDELATLAALMCRYLAELEYKATDGAPVDMDPHDAALLKMSIDKTEGAFEVIRKDLIEKLGGLI